MTIQALEHHRVVVTGASSGIGRAIARALAAAGARVLVHYHRNERGAEETCKCAPSHRAMTVCQADLTDAVGRKRLVDFAWQWAGGRVDAWINNAGADVLTGTAAQASFAEKLDMLWDLDVRGTVLLSREVLHQMRHQPRSDVPPLILFTGWDQAWQGMEGDAGQLFGTTKGAVMACAMSFAQAAAPDARVNCLAPGWIRTAWGEHADPEWQDRAQGEALLGRWGLPDDVAAAAVFLCRPCSAFINGQILPINGGWRRAK